MADSFFRKLGSTFGAADPTPPPQRPSRAQQQQQQPHGYQSPPPASRESARSRYDRDSLEPPHQRSSARGHPYSSPQPPSSSSFSSSHSYTPSPMRPFQSSPAPAAAASSSFYASAASAPSSANEPASYDHLSLTALRAEHARSEHSLSVCEMRLKHCLDSEDQSSSSEAARLLALEKRTFRELGVALASREKRDRSERAIREAIGTRFAGERHHIAEHRRQVETLKHRLRMAFAVPPQFGGAAAASPSGSAPSSANAANAASGASSPPPMRSPGGSTPPPSYSSAFSSSAAAAAPAEVSLFDLLPRMRLDVGKQQVALEHQNLRVDSIELSSCVEAAQAAMATAAAAQAAEAAAAAGPGAPGGPNGQAPVDRDFSPIQLQHPFSDELSGFFKSSRKEVVTSLQAVLAEVDGLTQHLKQAEAFILYLQIQPQQQPQHHHHSHHHHPAAAADDKMQS